MLEGRTVLAEAQLCSTCLQFPIKDRLVFEMSSCVVQIGNKIGVSSPQSSSCLSSLVVSQVCTTISSFVLTSERVSRWEMGCQS